jgi:hypothetical protein
VLGVIYSKAEGRIDEKKVYQLVTLEQELESEKRDQTQQASAAGEVAAISDLTKINSVVTNFLFFVQPKFRIAHWSPGSGNTKNIGSVRTVEQLVNGVGPFAGLGEDIYDDYWMYYLTTDMVREPGTKRPYTNLTTYTEYKRLGSQISSEYLEAVEKQNEDSAEVAVDAAESDSQEDDA